MRRYRPTLLTPFGHTCLGVMMICAALFILSGCTDKTGATKALKADGMTPVEVGGYSWFGCASDDDFATKFKARNIKGETVTGVVCSSWFLKGKTIRYD